MQVVRKELAVAQPTVICENLMYKENFMYEEDPGMDQDEIEDCASHLPKCLADLPSGGIKDGSIVEVSNRSQQLSFSLLVTHQVHQYAAHLQDCP